MYEAFKQVKSGETAMKGSGKDLHKRHETNGYWPTLSQYLLQYVQTNCTYL